MQIELIKEESFTVKIGGAPLSMAVKSRWNGLMELRTEHGDLLIVTEPAAPAFSDAFDSMFGDIFRTAREVKETGVHIVMGSPSLIAALRKDREMLADVTKL